jgi:hypothetical protein
VPSHDCLPMPEAMDVANWPSSDSQSRRNMLAQAQLASRVTLDAAGGGIAFQVLKISESCIFRQACVKVKQRI